MRLLIEEHQYESKDVVDVLDGFFTLQDIDNKISMRFISIMLAYQIIEAIAIQELD